MGGYLEKPLTEKHENSGSGNGIQFALSSMQGWRTEQEDAHACHISVNNGKLKNWSFFMVFDGHGGATASQMASAGILRVILEQAYFKQLQDCNIVTSYDTDKIVTAIKQAFLDMDAELRRYEESHTNIGGSTAVGCLIAPNHIFYINLGDSRAFSVRIKAGEQPASSSDKNSNTEVEFSTQDQKPGDPAEKARIIAAGGEVYALGSVGPERIQGELAVCRAFGDYSYKQNDELPAWEQQVCTVPVVSVVERHEQDVYIVIGCDGIYDVMSNEKINELCTFKMALQRQLDLQRTANELLETCLGMGSKDNMSAILLAFDDCRVPFDEDELIKDLAVQNTLRDFVNTELRNRGVNRPDVGVVIKNLPEERFDVPGGGIYGRALQISDMCEEYYKKLDETTPKPLAPGRTNRRGSAVNSRTASSSQRKVINSNSTSSPGRTTR